MRRVLAVLLLSCCRAGALVGTGDYFTVLTSSVGGSPAAPFYCLGQAFSNPFPSWAIANQTLFRVDTNEICAGSSLGAFSSISAINATQLAAAVAAQGVAVVQASACSFSYSTTYLESFVVRTSAILIAAGSTSALAGIVYWDAIPKPVELLTPYDAQGQTLFSNTQVPECVMSSVDGARLLPLLPAVANFSTLRLYRDSDDPAFSNGPGYYATYTPATYLPASGSAQPLLLSSATFNPPDFAATTLPVVAAPLSPSCLLNASQAWSDCAPCWAAPGSPFANAAALAGSVAFVDLNNLPSTIVAYYASFVPGLAAGGAAGMLFRGFPAQGAPQPMTPFLVPFAPGPPSWSVAFEDSAALAADLAASDACRVSFPANVGGNPVPAYYPATFTELGFATINVFDAGSSAPAVAVEACAAGQADFNPPSSPATPPPSASGSFAGVTRLLQVQASPACSSDANCSACDDAYPATLSLVSPQPAGAGPFAAWVSFENLPCAVEFEPVTAAAAYLGASALLYVTSSPAAFTIYGQANSSAPPTIPTYVLDETCGASIAVAGFGAYVSLPAVAAGVAVASAAPPPPPPAAPPPPASASTGGASLSGGGSGGGSALIPLASVLVQASDPSLALCPASGPFLAGRCPVGQGSYEPTTAPSTRALLVPIAPSPLCNSTAYCALCASVPQPAQRYAFAFTNGSGGAFPGPNNYVAGKHAILNAAFLVCRSLHDTAVELASSFGVASILFVGTAPAPLTLTGVWPTNASAPAFQLGSQVGLPLLRAAASQGIGVTVLTPQLFNGAAAIPTNWSNPQLVVNLSVAGGLSVAFPIQSSGGGGGGGGESGRVAGGVVGAVAAVLLVLAAVVMCYRRRLRRQQQSPFSMMRMYVGSSQPYVEMGHAYVVAAPGNTAMGQPVSGGGATVVGTPFTPPTRGQAIEAVAVGTAVRPVR